MDSRYVYAVHRGRRTGLFRTWDECKEQVHGYDGARFRKFRSPADAAHFVKTGEAPGGKDGSKAGKSGKPIAPTEERYWPIPSPAPLDKDKEPIIVYTDGSAKEDQKDKQIKGGYGIFFAPDDKRNFKERFVLPNPTNNRCEALAVRRAIEYVNSHPDDFPRDAELIVCTDSKYTIDAMRCRGGEWKNGSTANRGLLKSVWQQTQTRPVSMLYTPGHRGIEGNEGADRLANAAVDESDAISDDDGQPSATSS